MTEAFTDSEFNFISTQSPRLSHMDQNDWLVKNAEHHRDFGKAINENSSRAAKTLLISGPVAANSLVLSRNARDIDPLQISGLSRLQLHRAKSILSNCLRVRSRDIEQVCIWGNPSQTVYPDIRQATFHGKSAFKHVTREWFEEEFVPDV